MRTVRNPPPRRCRSHPGHISAGRDRISMRRETCGWPMPEITGSCDFRPASWRPGTIEPAADLVIGQADFISNSAPNCGGSCQINLSVLLQPQSLAFDGSGALYVADGYARVLYYPSSQYSDLRISSPGRGSHPGLGTNGDFPERLQPGQQPTERSARGVRNRKHGIRGRRGWPTAWCVTLPRRISFRPTQRHRLRLRA